MNFRSTFLLTTLLACGGSEATSDAEVAADLDALAKQVQALEEALDDRHAHDEAQDALLEDVADQVEALSKEQDEVLEAADEVAEHAEAVAAHAEAIEQEVESVQEIGDDIDDALETVGQVETQVASLSDDLAAVEGDLQTLVDSAATEAWVQQQDYATQEALDDLAGAVATESWVLDHGYATQEDLEAIDEVPDELLELAEYVQVDSDDHEVAFHTADVFFEDIDVALLDPANGQAVEPLASRAWVDSELDGLLDDYTPTSELEDTVDGFGYAKTSQLDGYVKFDDKVDVQGDDIIVTGNLYVQNGEGSTDTENGLGNIIVGYNEDDDDRTRTGSHNVVVGPQHGWQSHGGIVAGYDNRILEPHASVLGGSENDADGQHSVIVGGTENVTTGFAASVLGGGRNESSGSRTVVTGGEGNLALGSWSVVVGGGTSSTSSGNVTASGATRAVVVGGRENSASDTEAVVLGGWDNEAAERRVVVLGGEGIVEGGYQELSPKPSEDGGWD